MGTRHLLHRATEALGLEIHRYRVGTEFSRTRQRLIARHGVVAALDVGGGVGGYGLELRENGFAGEIVSFEPLTESYRRLSSLTARDPHWTPMPFALGAATTVESLNISARATSSSILEMEPRHTIAAPDSHYVATETVHVARLDDLYPEIHLPGGPLLLKIDVQGYEVPVLDGATETLDRVAVLEAELSFVELYRGQALFPEVLKRLQRQGFVLTSFESVLADPDTAELLQLNGLFHRP